MKIKNGDQVKIVSRDGETFSHPVGTILTVVNVGDANYYPPKPAPCCVDDKGDLVWVMLKNLEKVFEEPTKQASTILQRIQTFTLNHKNLEISFEDGMMEVRDWRGKGDPVEYKCDTVEQLEELMSALATTCKYC